MKLSHRQTQKETIPIYKDSMYENYEIILFHVYQKHSWDQISGANHSSAIVGYLKLRLPYIEMDMVLMDIIKHVTFCRNIPLIIDYLNCADMCVMIF